MIKVTTQAVQPKLTRGEQLLMQYDAIKAQIDSQAVQLQGIINEINQIDALATVGVGSVVTISVGKGDTAKDVLATVIGVRAEGDGSLSYKVAYGSGFDADMEVIKAWRIVGVGVANPPSAP